MSSDFAIKVENLSKCYHIYDQPRDRLMQMLTRGRKQYYREFWALKDVSFGVKRGETIGIIGKNGSGKSTLLQMICGTLNPTAGTIQTNGRIAALLELGSGFNPEFTGRENIYLNASVLGLTNEEIDGKFDKIADFADIGDFIEQPIKTYSSGMALRLAFAVQCQVEPDILVIDEALAVGDAKFQAKCFEHLKTLKKNGTSILLVTHSSEQIVTHCDQAILLNNGCVAETGKPRIVVNRYLDILFGKEKMPPKSLETETSKAKIQKTSLGKNLLSRTEDLFSSRPGYNPHEYRWGDGKASILDYYLSTDYQDYTPIVSTGQNIRLGVSIVFNSDLVRPILGITIKTKEGVTVYGVNSEIQNVDGFKSLGKGGSVVNTEMTFCCQLATGDYFISLGIATKEGEEIIPHDRRYDSIHLQVLPDESFFGLIDLGIKMNVQGDINEQTTL